MRHLIALLRYLYREVPGAEAHIDWLEAHSKHVSAMGDSDPQPPPEVPPGG